MSGRRPPESAAGNPLKVMAVFGTRPEAIKMAPVVRRLQEDPASFRVTVTVTAQHREMLDQVLEHFRIRPDHDLNVMTPRQTLTGLTTAILEGLKPLLEADPPDIVLVHGDATTTFGAALAAFYARCSVGHVEAGLRTGDKFAPWPEEVNRRLAGVIADLHFAPTPRAAANLRAEGVAADRVFITGNTVIDALMWTVDSGHRFCRPALEEELERAGRAGERVVLVECHRRENWGRPMVRVFRTLKRFAREEPGVKLFVSAHLNPEAGEVARRELDGLDNVVLFPPVPYPDWVNLMARSYLIFTDSGGLQEEAPSLGRPLLLAREKTERPEAVQAGTVLLVGTSEEAILSSLRRLVRDEGAYRLMASRPNPFGDGRASDRIAAALLHHFRRTSRRPEEFRPPGSGGFPAPGE